MSTPTVTTEPRRALAGHPGPDDGTAAFCSVRNRLLGIASRILGRRTEAEDVVQDAWLRWQLYDRTTVANPTAFLVTTTTRLAINATQSARVRREASVGEWMSEPAATADDPALGVEQREALELGIQVVLERLEPRERAAYVLHEAFDYSYPRIAQILQTTEANARQLASRAGKHIAADRRRSVSSGEHRRLLDAFVAAARHGAVDDLEQHFAAPSSVSSAPRSVSPTRASTCCAVTQMAHRPPDARSGRYGPRSHDLHGVNVALFQLS